MKVTCSKRLLAHFRKFAKESHPREAYAVLLGKLVPDGVRVTQLYIPEGQREVATPYQVTVSQTWLADAARLGAINGEVVIGDIHSHVPRCKLSNWREDGAPSSGDWRCASHYIHAICLVTKTPKGALRSRVTFWPSRLDLTEKITE
jgi:hypothetical protein